MNNTTRYSGLNYATNGAVKTLRQLNEIMLFQPREGQTVRDRIASVEWVLREAGFSIDYDETRKQRVAFECACGCGEIGYKTPYYIKRSKRLFIDQKHRTQWYHRRGLPKLKTQVATLGAGMTKSLEASTKWCEKCRSRKPLREFASDPKRYDGKTPTCRTCRTEMARQRRERKNKS